MATPENGELLGSSLLESITIDHASLNMIIESAIWQTLSTHNNDADAGDRTRSGKLLC